MAAIIDTVTPRGAPPGTSVAIAGSGFGAATGQVIFDPLGQAIAAAIGAWDPQNITFTVPTLPSPLSNQFITVQVVVDGNADGGTFLFWSPQPGFDVSTAHPSLDYQLPALEEGPDQDVDDPRTITAADFNRLLGVAASGVGLGGFVLGFGGGISPGSPYTVLHGTSAALGAVGSSFATRGTVPVAASLVAIAWGASGAGTIDVRRNGSVVVSFPVTGPSNGVFVLPSSEAFAAGDYLEMSSGSTVSVIFDALFTTP